jgi:hypothetical protein
MENNLDPNTLEPKPENSVAPESAMDRPELEALEAQPMELEGEEEETPPSASGRSKKWYLFGGLLVVFLAAAVFLGIRLLKPQGAGAAFGGGEMMISSKGGPTGAKSVRINMSPAKEVPQDKPSAAGIFVRREDQSIFIGTGNIRMMVKKSSNSSGSDVSSDYDGPVVEVVINHDTNIYQDVTEMPEPDKAKDGVLDLQQVVKPGSLDDLGANGQVTVWGDKQGDRFIARVIVFR